MIDERSDMILVTGLARSGTTLVAECLDYHPEVMCISDAANEFFKGFMRFAYRYVEGEVKDAGYPIDHFFFSGSPAVSRFVDQTDFRHRIPADLKAEILERIAIRDGEYCPEIKAPVRKCRAESFDELFVEILDLLYRTYGKPGTRWFGTKATWCEQLLPALARTYPNMFFVNTMRDPRAVTASHYISGTSRYPLLFHVRDWRKSVYYTWKHQQPGSDIAHRFVWVRYEDLVQDPAGVLSTIAAAAGIPYDARMAEGAFKKPNTSHADVAATHGISSAFKDKWKQALPPDVVQQIDVLCAYEMWALGYLPAAGEKLLDAYTALSSQPIPYESLSGWCQQIVGTAEDYAHVWVPANNLVELARLKWLESPGDLHDSWTTRAFFYDDAYFAYLKSGRPLRVER